MYSVCNKIYLKAISYYWYMYVQVLKKSETNKNAEKDIAVFNDIELCFLVVNSSRNQASS